MKIYTSDSGKSILLFSQSLWHSLYSTAVVRLSEDDKDFLQFAMDFLNAGNCAADDAQITARQLELMRKRFAKIVPEKAVYNRNKSAAKAQWGDGGNQTATSCADFFITADGKDLFEEMIGLLKYADQQNVDTLSDL